ncbi:MAG: adenylate/guanylate cyclase domain-containing protein [Candidatus Riflebacteria bacterium]|nr:adenylate/guanylate cyclase domain-containing protein [Candidatus Riflebacteria bacterium]
MTTITTATKVIAPEKPEPGKMLIFWFFVFALPALLCRLGIGVYAKTANEQGFFSDSEKLRLECDSFHNDLKPENLILKAFGVVKNQLEHLNLPESSKIEPASLSRHITSLFSAASWPTPVFCATRNLADLQTGSFRKPDSPINPGRRSLETIMSHLYPDSLAKQEENEKRYQMICKTVFGSFLEPAARSGVLKSGFFVKGKADRLFILHDSFINATDGRRFAWLMIFSENSTGLRLFLKNARLNASSPEFTRSYAMLPVIPDREFRRTDDNRVFFATAISPAVLRIGSHAGNSWYDASIKNGSAARKPAKIPFIVVSKNSTATFSDFMPYRQLIDLALLIFVFGGLATTRQFLTGRISAAPLQKKFKGSLLAATLMPFMLMIFTAEEFSDHFSRATISSQTQNITNDMQMLELNIISHDLRERQITSRFVAELDSQRNASSSELKQKLESERGKLFEGYALLRSDGTYLENLPDKTGVSSDDYNKLQMVKELNFSQLYNIFSVAGALKPEFAKNTARLPEFVKWKAFAGHFNGIDRDSFCIQDGRYFMSRNAEKNYYRISFHNLFPDKDKTELWAGLTLVKNSRSSIEKFLLEQGSANMAFKNHDDLKTHSAIFRRHEDGGGLDSTFVWPTSARNDRELLNAAGHLNENLLEATWLKHDNHGMTTIFSARAMPELPFIIVSRCLISSSAVNKRLFQLAAILLIPYAMLLFALLSSLLADTFLMPLTLLIHGVESLENGNYPTVRYSADNELGALICHFNSMSEDMRQRKLLQRFISEEVSSSISEEAEKMQESAGSLVYRTIMFIHIRDFSTICEKIAPEQSIALLNHYFTSMEPCINRFNGQIDKYIADAIMLSFSREKCREAPESAACQAALSCISALKDLNSRLTAAGLPEITLGVGIAAGNVIRGKIGAKRGRQDFTLIGDPVNLAARLESISHFGNDSHILIDQNIERAVKTVHQVCFYAQMPVKGKSEPVKVFELQEKPHGII